MIVTRIEQLVDEGIVCAGMSVTITNDRSLWQASRRIGTVDEAFRLNEGRAITGRLSWGAGASAGTMRGREKALDVAGLYTLEWVNYEEVEARKNGDFRMLIVEVDAANRCGTGSEVRRADQR